MAEDKLSESESETQISDIDGEGESEINEVDVKKTFGSKLWSWIRSCMWIFWCFCTILLIVYICGGSLILFSREAKMEIIFANRIRIPWFANFSDCRSFGLAKCENIYIRGSDGLLGAWFISPPSNQYITREAYMLYLHGSGGSRAMPYRIMLYKKLSKMGYHILAIDYRGFGDSDSFPTEEGLVEDSKVAFKWLVDKYAGFPHYIWGHSLGSGVAIQLAAWLNSEHSRLNGLILEAPFNNLTDVFRHGPLFAPVAPFIPNFDSYTADVKNVFRSSYWIKKVTTPTLILHDKSDINVNVALGRKLYLAAKEVGSTNVQMVEFDEKLGHEYICTAKKIKGVISTFVYNTS